MAAFKEFAARGVAGARVDRIAERAKANKRMLYYYFGSKEGLFTEVLRRIVAVRSERVRTTTASRLVERLPASQQFQLQQTEYVRLLMWEALERGARGPIVEEEAR